MTFFFGKSRRDGKKWLSYSFSAGENLTEYWNFIIEIFCRPVLFTETHLVIFLCITWMKPVFSGTSVAYIPVHDCTWKWTLNCEFALFPFSIWHVLYSSYLCYSLWIFFWRCFFFNFNEGCTLRLYCDYTSLKRKCPYKIYMKTNFFFKGIALLKIDKLAWCLISSWVNYFVCIIANPL